jgi:SAM-dependent methyltransferase
MNCRICDGSELDLAVDLGQQPWCNDFLTLDQLGKEPFDPLRVVLCRRCQAAQLDFTVRKEIMFGDHTYLSGVTRSLNDHFARVAAEVDTRFFSNQSAKAVLDIGSNDGTQLKHFAKLGYSVLGVESSKTTARLAQDAGVPTLNEFFNLGVARRLDRKFDIINAAGVFFHLEELHSVTEGIRELLRDDGVFVVQFLYMKRILENLAFDQIYHEHLLYYNLQTIETLLRRHELTMFDAYLAPIHGGSIIGFVGHPGRRTVTDRLQQLHDQETAAQANSLATYLHFNHRLEAMKRENLAFLGRARDAGKRVFGLGAPVKGNTLLNYFGIGPDTIECLVEKNPLRRDRYSPGMHIPVVLESELKATPEIYYVLAWNFRREILTNYQPLIERGVEFYFPVNPPDDIP